MYPRRCCPVFLACLILNVGIVFAQPDVHRAETTLATLRARVKGFEAIRIPQEVGTVKVSADRSLTIEKLRGVQLDDHPPKLGKPVKPYPANMTDDYPPGKAPYVARGIQPFRFRYFNNEFSYGGWHNWAMQDYAITHGFNVVYPYNRKPMDWSHAPKGTKWLRWGGFVDWPKWLKKHDIGALRYDKLLDMDIVQMLENEHVFKPNPGYDQLMIDMEHPRLAPEKLRQQPWYPRAGDETERRTFEKTYYEGYALTYTAPIRAARQMGWKNISVYGWEPFLRTYWGLENVRLDPATDWAWNAFGRRIYQAVDILNPSVYCFYWTPNNVAYTLANIDLNMKLVEAMPNRKPVRPYYWTLLHGGGGEKRWWTNQPMVNEDVRAMTACCFFAGCDGLVLWNWSGTGNHHRPPTLKPGVDVMVGRGFEWKTGGHPAVFKRYDVLHIVEVAPAGNVTFRRIEKDNPRGKYGLTDDKPIYTMPRDELRPHLRSDSDPVSAMVEGLALVKPLEYLLRHGEVKVDMPARKQFAETLPIIRRVKLGPYHVIATYDPLCVHGGPPRRIVVTNFDGRKGLTLDLPADAETRIFVLRVPPDP